MAQGTLSSKIGTFSDFVFLRQSSNKKATSATMKIEQATYKMQSRLALAHVLVSDIGSVLIAVDPALLRAALQIQRGRVCR